MGNKRSIAGMRTGLTAAVVLLLLGNAVALGAIEPPSEAPVGEAVVPTLPSSPVALSTPSSAPTSAAVGKATPSTTRPTAKSAATTTTTEPPWVLPLSVGEYTYEVTMSPVCLTPGAPFTVTMHLLPNHAGGIVAMYSDGESYGTRFAGYAGPDGILTYPGVAGKAVGQAILLTNSMDDQRRSGATRVHFRVVEAGDQC